MEIEQFLYDLNDSGDAVVGYTMTSASGGVVQLCNLGASVLSYEVAGVGQGSLLEGRCVRSTDFGGGPADLIDGVRFDEMLWESRVETNRVVMSLQYEDRGVDFMLEVIFDFDDDNTFEVTYIGCLSQDSAELEGVQFDLTHNFSSPLKVADMCDLGGVGDSSLYLSGSAKQNILSRIMVLDGGVEVLSSQPQVGLSDSGFVLLTSPQRSVSVDDRYIQKSVFRIVK
ncbi:MAG: hypothetical protein SNH79_06510 [Rikenellaceae bacterium]